MKTALLSACVAFGAFPALAGEPIDVPSTAIRASVTQPHVTAELICEANAFPNHPLEVVLHLHMDHGWHTYWVNPGDAGLATTITWELQPWIKAVRPIQWPVPEREAMGPLTTYGYSDDVYLPTTLDLILPFAGSVGEVIPIKAHVEWLVCQENCIPGSADLTLTVPISPLTERIDYVSFLRAVHARLPAANHTVTVSGHYETDRLDLVVTGKGNGPVSDTLSFYPEQPNVLATKSNAIQIDRADPATGSWRGHLALEQNGEKPGSVSGVLVGFGPTALQITEFPVTSGPAKPSGK